MPSKVSASEVAGPQEVASLTPRYTKCAPRAYARVVNISSADLCGRVRHPHREPSNLVSESKFVKLHSLEAVTPDVRTRPQNLEPYARFYQS